MIYPCGKPCGNKTESGYCATTACINPQYSNIGTAHYGQGVQKCIVTNADRIRAMTDDELAELFWIRADCKLCPCKADHCSDDCKGAWLNWLRQEATSEQID